MTDDTSAPDREDVDELAERVDKINESLEDLEIRIEVSGPEIVERFRDVITRLKADRSAVASSARTAAAATGDAWRTIVSSAQQALDRLERELAAAWADLEASLADDVDSFKNASSRQLDSWKSYVEELKLQARLAGMEAREALGELDKAFDAARPQLEEARSAADDTWEQTKRGVGELVARLWDAAQTVSAEMRSGARAEDG